MLDRKAEADAAAEGIAHHVDLPVAELLQDQGDIVADRLEIDRTVAELGAAVPVQVDRDNLPALRERRKDGAEHVDGAEPAMEKQQRLACPVHLIIIADAVRLDIAAPRRLGGGCGGGCLGLSWSGRGRRERHGEEQRRQKCAGHVGLLVICPKDVARTDIPTCRLHDLGNRALYRLSRAI